MQPTSPPPWERFAAPEYTAGPSRPPVANGRPSRSPRAKRAAAVGATTVAMILAGWIGVAVADNSDPTTTTAPNSGAPAAPAAVPGAPGAPAPGQKGPGGPHGPGFGGPGDKGGPRGAVHGQFTVPDGSGFRTVDEQSGQVTAVSHDSITVKSADGFTKTYTVTDNTLVNAGRDGIGSVKTGDTVNVQAIEHDGTVEAAHINDATTNQAIHDHWKPAPPPKTSPTTTP